jgi:hypothetical protein
MARKPELAELTTRLAMQALGSERRYTKILVFGGIGVVVLAAGILVGARYLDAKETAAREEAFGSLGLCLLGPDPLKSGETASGRLANVKLGVVGVAPEKRTKAGDLAWPASCATPAYALLEHAGDSPLGKAAEALAKALKADASATADLHAEVDKVWAEAAAAKLEPKAPKDAVAGPKPIEPLFTAEQFKALPKFLSGSFGLVNVREEAAPTKTIFFLIDQKDTPDGPVLCAAEAADATIKCMKAPEAVATLSPGLRLVGTIEEGARPFWFAGDRGQLGIFPPDGKHAIAASVAYGATSRKDGSVDFVTRKEGLRDLRLVHQPAVGPTVETPLLQPTEFDVPVQTGLFWDWFVYRSVAKPGPPPQASHLWARKIEGPVVKPAVDVGELDEPPPPDKADRDRDQLSGCQSGDALAVRVRGQKNDVVAFYASGRWAAPVKAPTHGGALTCRGIEAVLTTVDHAVSDKDYATITQARCNTSGCTTTSIQLRQMLAGVSDIAPADAGGVVAADVGGKLLLVYNGGLAGGLRMRFAAPDQVKDAAETVITDGRDDKGGSVSTIAQMRVLSAANWALLFLSTTSGVKVMRVDGAGKLTPLTASL